MVARVVVVRLVQSEIGSCRSQRRSVGVPDVPQATLSVTISLGPIPPCAVLVDVHARAKEEKPIPSSFMEDEKTLLHWQQYPGQTVADRLKNRSRGLQAWLKEKEQGGGKCFREQKHLDRESVERPYSH